MNAFDAAVLRRIEEHYDEPAIAAHVREHHLGNSRALSPTQCAHEADLPADSREPDAVDHVASGYVGHVAEVDL